MYAAIDVGSNTVRMLLGTVRQGRIVPTRYERHITRLKGGMTREKGLAPEAMERTLSALRSCADILAQHEIDGLHAVGTQALRSAANSAAFLAAAASFGIEIDIIDGEREAAYSASGVLSALEPVPRQALVVDIGGGSTEFVVVADGAPVDHASYPLGVVALVEEHSPDRHDDLIDRMLDDSAINWPAGGFTLVGTAGTATTIAALLMKMTRYDWRRVNNFRVPGDVLQGLLDVLVPLSVEDRELLPGMEPGRGDLIVPGMKIFRQIINRCGLEEMVVSDFGLLEGVLLDLAEKH